MCEQVSVGCVWLRLIRSSWESSPLGYICSCHALSFVRSLQCLRSTFTVRSGSWFRDSWALLSWTRFMSPAASWTPIAGPWLPIASLRYPPLPYGKLRLCPTESSASAYGKLRFCLRKAPPLPTESSAIHFVFWLFLSINLSSCNWILQALSLWHCRAFACVRKAQGLWCILVEQLGEQKHTVRLVYRFTREVYLM